MKPLRDCQYTAFISYAHADDEAWFHWVSQFRRELERGLAAMLRGVPLPPMHLSGDNGPVAGVLGDELRARVAQSFAMVIVVHDNYAMSDWCLKELEVFRELNGDAGCAERLYIVALSESAMNSVAGGAAWRRLFPGGQQLWMPFFDADDRSQPLPIYMGPELVTPQFREQILRLRKDLAAKLKAASEARPATGAAAVAAAPGPASSTATTDTPAPAAAPADAPAGAPVVFGFVGPGAAAVGTADVAQRLRERGCEVRQLSTDAVFDDFAAMAGAGQLVLAFDDAPLMMASLAAGGHLQLQREAWLRKGHDATQLRWLDLRAAPTPPPAGSAAAWVASLGVEVFAPAALLQRLRPAMPAPLPQDVRIYIESNRHELTLWKPMGERIRSRWQQLSDQAAAMPGALHAAVLNLRARGLPVDQIDAYPNLDDADGVVLLWGRKSADALVAQINKVETKMSPGRDAAPGVVAYLMPPQSSTEPVPAWGWQVLRFDATDEQAVDVVAADDAGLDSFLREVLQRRLQRNAAGPR